MSTKTGDKPISKDTARDSHLKTVAHVQAPSLKQGGGRSVLYEFLDLNLKSADYRNMIHEANKDAK